MAESPTATRLWADVSPDKPGTHAMSFLISYVDDIVNFSTYQI